MHGSGYIRCCNASAAASLKVPEAVTVPLMWVAGGAAVVSWDANSENVPQGTKWVVLPTGALLRVKVL